MPRSELYSTTGVSKEAKPAKIVSLIGKIFFGRAPLKFFQLMKRKFFCFAFLLLEELQKQLFAFNPPSFLPACFRNRVYPAYNFAVVRDLIFFGGSAI